VRWCSASSWRVSAIAWPMVFALIPSRVSTHAEDRVGADADEVGLVALQADELTCPPQRLARCLLGQGSTGVDRKFRHGVGRPAHIGSG
jgi:hypothetical protein